jgi:3-hydroxyisobutyrate dehydrogenase-like beta-hydroxyacid dehydrogenase
VKIGFIGLGKMGGPMALNLIRAGHDVIVHDLLIGNAGSALDLGAAWAGTPAGAAAGRELVLCSLPGPQEVDDVVYGAEGILDAIPQSAIFADLSTNSPVNVRKLGEAFAERGVGMLDAPVSGGVPGATQGNLLLIVGGERGVFDRAQETLAALGTAEYVGALGCGSIAKIVHNMVSMVSIKLLSEGFTLGTKAGCDPSALLGVMRGGGFGQGFLLWHVVEKVALRGDFASIGFSLSLAQKDLRLAMDLGRAFSVPMPLSALGDQAFTEAAARGLDDLGSAAVWAMQEDAAAVQVRTRGDA